MHIQGSSALLAQSMPGLSIQFRTSLFPGGYEVSCFGAQDGNIQTLVTGGTPPYTYQWSHGAQTPDLQQIAAGSYELLVTDAQGHSVSQTILLKSPAALQAFALTSNYHAYEISKNGGSDGSIDIQTQGGTPPYTYQWSNGSSSAKLFDLPAGTYSLAVSDANACSTSLQVVLHEPAALTGNASLLNAVSCYGAQNGAALAQASGGVPPYTYQWDQGGFSEQAQELNGGDHHVLVTDANGASIMLSVQIPEPPKITVNAQVSSFANGFEVSCHQCYNGQIQTQVQGGTPPYQYAWTGPAGAQSSPALLSLGKGKYELVITDAAGCLAEESFTLNSPEREDWTIFGNQNVNSQTQFIGTLDTSSIAFRTQNTERLKISGQGGIEIMDTLQLKNYNNGQNTGTRFLGLLPDGKVVPTQIFDMDGVILNASSNCANVMAWGKHYTNTPLGPVMSNSDDIFKCPLDGNVGIGTAQPQAKVDIVGDIAISGSRLHVGHDNKIGINTDQPTQALDVAGNTRIANELHTYGSTYHHDANAGSYVEIRSDGSNGYIDFEGNAANPGKLILNGNSIYEIWLDGKTTVAGQLDACKVVVEHNGWCDYVFADDYQLPALSEVESFIKENKHLPGIPSEETLKQENLDLGKMQKMQMEKIEQLMLYVIQLNNKLSHLETENENLKASLRK
jgi:hypothetical protein